MAQGSAARHRDGDICAFTAGIGLLRAGAAGKAQPSSSCGLGGRETQATGTLSFFNDPPVTRPQ